MNPDRITDSFEHRMQLLEDIRFRHPLTGRMARRLVFTMASTPRAVLGHKGHTEVSLFLAS